MCICLSDYPYILLIAFLLILQLCGWFSLFEGKWSESEHEMQHFVLGDVRPFCSDTAKTRSHLLFALYWGFFFGGFGQVYVSCPVQQLQYFGTMNSVWRLNFCAVTF